MNCIFDHYTNVISIGKNICLRLRDPLSKQASYYKIPFQPETFTPCSLSDATDNWRTLDGMPLRMTKHSTLYKYHEYVEMAEKTGRRVYGTISPVQQFIAKNMSKRCGVPFSALRTVFLDIEVGSEGGFAPPDNPWQPITAITAEVWGQYYVWGCGAFQTEQSNITYIECKSEVELLHSFLTWWTQDYPDIITGWNTHTYDVPYIINRIDKLQADEEFPLTGNVLSPWRKLSYRIATIMNKETRIVDIAGISVLDYLELYRKFSLTQRESYRLDAIAEIELGKKKVSFDEYGSLQKLAEENYQKFIEYNITDVHLVRELNDKLHHLDLCTQIAYGARVNFLDTFKQVRLWDSMMYYELHDRQIAIPPKIQKEKSADYMGAYVKDPIVGQHSWVVSFDVNSLYPSIMRQWNISPDRHLTIETLRNILSDVECVRGAMRPIQPTADDCTPRDWLNGVREEDAAIVRWALAELITVLETTNIEQTLASVMQSSDPFPYLRVLSLCLTPNKQAFRTDSHGFLPEILGRLYEERKQAKKKETDAKKKATKAHTDDERRQYEQEAVQWGLQQNVRKINLNSCYGAVGNEHFRFFDVRQAEAVTMTGQLIIRYLAHEVNTFLNAQFGTSGKDYVLASDTDSIYLTLAPAVVLLAPSEANIVKTLDEYCETHIQPVIDKAFQTLGRIFNTPDNVLAMKREAIAEYGVWTAKKRYLLWVHDNEGVRYDPPKLKTVGIEAVRSSTPKYAREIIKKALEYFIRGDKDQFYRLLEDAEEGYRTRPFEEIASPRSCNGLNEYPLLENGQFSNKTPIHVKGALVYNRQIERTQTAQKYPKIHNGEKIRFCYLKPRNPLRSNVIAAPNTLPQEWNLEKYLDRDEQFEKTVLSPLEMIIKHAQWVIRPAATLDF